MLKGKENCRIFPLEYDRFKIGLTSRIHHVEATILPLAFCNEMGAYLLQQCKETVKSKSSDNLFRYAMFESLNGMFAGFGTDVPRSGEGLDSVPSLPSFLRLCLTTCVFPRFPPNLVRVAPVVFSTALLWGICSLFVFWFGRFQGTPLRPCGLL